MTTPSPRQVGLTATSETSGQPIELPFAVAFANEAEALAQTDAAKAPTVVVITGASSGVGRATAHAYARRGARIGLIARGVESLEATAREVVALGGKAAIAPADVADPERLEEAAREIERTLGPIEIWINDAAASVFSTVSRATPEELRRVMEVTYLGAAHGAQTALRRMRARNHGTIVMLGSSESFHGAPRSAAESAAKHALQGFVDSLRAELMHEDSAVHITMVHLPSLNTPHFAMARSRLRHRPQPTGPVYEPEVAAEGILEAVDQQRRELFIGPRTQLTALLARLSPSLLDYIYARRAFDALESTEPDDPSRPDNLLSPISGDHGLHGAWRGRARSKSLHLALSTHRGLVALALLLAAAAIALLLR